MLSPSTVNTFWEFTHQSKGIIGNSNQPWNQFYSLDEGFAYSHNLQMPVHNLLDDFSWIKGSVRHQYGFERDPRVSYLHSFSRAWRSMPRRR